MQTLCKYLYILTVCVIVKVQAVKPNNEVKNAKMLHRTERGSKMHPHSVPSSGAFASSALLSLV